MCCINWLMLMSGSWMSAFRPATTSRKLCGGILVAMPTAIPAAPLTSRCGTLAGSTAGSSCIQHHKGCFQVHKTQVLACNLYACLQASCVASWCWLRPTTDRKPLLCLQTVCLLAGCAGLSAVVICPKHFLHNSAPCHPTTSMRAEVLLTVMQQYLRFRS